MLGYGTLNQKNSRRLLRPTPFMAAAFGVCTLVGVLTVRQGVLEGTIRQRAVVSATITIDKSLAVETRGLGVISATPTRPPFLASSAGRGAASLPLLLHGIERAGPARGLSTMAATVSMEKGLAAAALGQARPVATIFKGGLPAAIRGLSATSALPTIEKPLTGHASGLASLRDGYLRYMAGAAHGTSYTWAAPFTGGDLVSSVAPAAIATGKLTITKALSGLSAAHTTATGKLLTEKLVAAATLGTASPQGELLVRYSQITQAGGRRLREEGGLRLTETDSTTRKV